MAAPDWRPRRRIKDTDLMKRLHYRGGRCALEDDTCDPVALELHHIYPRSQGGDDVEANLAFLCRDHHRRITFREPEALEALSAFLRSNRPDTVSYLSERLGGEERASEWLRRYL